MEKIKVFMIRQFEGGPALIDTTTGGVLNELENACPGDSYVIEVSEMTQEELDKLPEFDGF